MAKNDIILIDGILDNYHWSENEGENFEFFSLEQILKDYDISEDEINTGIVDGRNDGGIDGIYYLVNNRLITDITSEFDSRSAANLTIYIITCKHESSFKMVPINNMSTTLDEFFDLTLETSDLKSEYNEDIIEKRRLLKKIYGKIAPYLVEFDIHIIYSSRGSTNELAENVEAKARYLEDKVREKFGVCNVTFEFMGSTELLELYRKKRQLIAEIKCHDIISCNDSYIAICNLKDYYNFIIDEDKKLKRYYLDSNVRAYMGNNRVNKDIMETLKNNCSTEFWFLNNGITILSNKVTLVGKTACVENAQIVNGLQTTETIYNFFSRMPDESFENRNILLKIIVSDDKKMRDDIIKSTNNQTNVELYSLKATDKIQRDIEDILLKNDLYYERRTNYYLNQGVEKDKIFSPLYLAYGYISLIMKLPYKSVSLKAKFMNKPNQYTLVFSEDIPIEIWPVIAKILRRTDIVIEQNRNKYYKNVSTPNLLKYTRNIVSFLSVSRIMGKFDFNAKDLINIDLSKLSDEIIADTFEQVVNIEENYRSMRKKQPVLNVCEKFAYNNNIPDVEKILNRFNPFSISKQYELTEEFIQQVKDNLPLQPWPIGIHTKIAKKLNEYTPKVSQAIHELIKRGDFYYQRNGELYDLEGNVIVEGKDLK